MALELITMEQQVVTTICYILMSMIRRPVLTFNFNDPIDIRCDYLFSERTALSFKYGIAAPLWLTLIVGAQMMETDYLDETTVAESGFDRPD